MNSFGNMEQVQQFWTAYYAKNGYYASFKQLNEWKNAQIKKIYAPITTENILLVVCSIASVIFGYQAMSFNVMVGIVIMLMPLLGFYNEGRRISGKLEALTYQMYWQNSIIMQCRELDSIADGLQIDYENEKFVFNKEAPLDMGEKVAEYRVDALQLATSDLIRYAKELKLNVRDES